MPSFRILLCVAVLPAVAAFSKPAVDTARTTSVPTDSRQRVFVGTPSKEIHRLVSDCMTPRERLHVLYPHVSCDSAISLLLNNAISGAPVVSPDTGKLLGIISSSDFIFKDYTGAVINMEGSSANLANCVEVAKKIVGSTVEDLMANQVMTIKSHEPMATAADHMARNNLHRLMVVDPTDESTLVGILTRSDIMRDVMSTVRAALPERGTHEENHSESGLQP